MIDPKDIPRLTEMLKKHEGCKTKWYKDSEGYLTIGIGHMATKSDDTNRDWTMTEVMDQFDKDLKTAVDSLRIACPWVENLDSPRHCALVDHCFNVGISRLLGFKKMLKSLQKGDWVEAEKQALDSLWAAQVGNRAKELGRIYRNGKW